MVRSPKGNLDDLRVSKGDDDPPAPAIGERMKSYAHTLSLRLTAEQYRRLRLHVRAQEDATGARITHQAIIETALSEYLDRRE